METVSDKLLEPATVDAILGIKPRRRRRLIASGALRSVKLGPRITRVSAEALAEFIDRGGLRPEPER